MQRIKRKGDTRSDHPGKLWEYQDFNRKIGGQKAFVGWFLTTGVVRNQPG
jgi:hypothetical protein